MKKSDAVKRLNSFLEKITEQNKNEALSLHLIKFFVDDLGFLEPCTQDQGNGCNHTTKNQCFNGWQLEDYRER